MHSRLHERQGEANADEDAHHRVGPGSQVQNYSPGLELHDAY